ncbi:hypothetical protein ZIOFF_050618 [Zingiber officinale]|uniref:Light-mediated development protein DET1 n=1 Tax=Zingiber officinale TaxID=94328 RepID=A0A8J5KQI2_ZINOF|nr:hypothetical protein ZIOFF_050618 [Zingiber officinale]
MQAKTKIASLLARHVAGHVAGHVASVQELANHLASMQATTWLAVLINFVRQFYENLVPGCTICDIDCPDHSFRKFTDDGQYLVSFSMNMQDIIVFRPKWLSYSFKGENCDHQTLAQKAKKFDSFFTHLYSISLGSSNESICKDFFLYLENHQFGLFATTTQTQIHELASIDGTVLGFPSIEKITFHLVRLNDGVVMDEKSFRNDYVSLIHNMGVFLHDNLLCVFSLRYQTIHILQVRESGNLVDVRSIGPFCLEDDELFLKSHSQCSEVVNKSRSEESVHLSTNNIHHQQVTQANSFLSGIKQRLLSFIFRKAWNEESDPSLVQLKPLLNFTVILWESINFVYIAIACYD